MTTAGPEPGWYIDPDGAEGVQRYWNGAEWTEHRSAGLPKPAPTPVQIVRPPRRPVPTAVKATIGVAVAVAVIIGVVLMWKEGERQIKDGQRAVVLACMNREERTGSLSPDEVFQKCLKEAGADENTFR